MIIQILADKGILGEGKKKIIVSVDYTKPLAQAIPNILSKLLLTKKESFNLYFTTVSTCLESGLGQGEVDPNSEATSSTGGLTISSAGRGSADGVPTCSPLAGSPTSASKQIMPLPIMVDWNNSPQQLRLRSNGCYLWIKRSSKSLDEPVDLDADVTASEQVQRLLEEAKPYDPTAPFEYLVGITANTVPYCFVARRDIPAGQVLFRENLSAVDAYPCDLVAAIAENKMMSLNLPYDKEFTAPSQSSTYSNEQWGKALSQATMNGVAVGDKMGFAPWASVFKRSCWPNAMSFLSPDKHTVDVVALDAISQGDEVTLPWDCIVDQFWLPQKRRLEYVQEKYDKGCVCGRCLHPSEEDKTLTGAFSTGNSKLAEQVMRAEYAAAVDRGDRQQMITFIKRYQKSDEDSDVAKPSIQLHKNHWRLCSLRDKLLDWYRVSPKKRMDKRLPVILLDQLEMCTSVMPKFYPPKLKPYRQWRALLDLQTAQVAALLKRMARERSAIDWAVFAQLDALEQYWNQARVAGIPRIATPPQTDESANDDW
eukprot:TRINITY_DN7346_c0_g3_i1.p1 TRINITY_DN7346_c0_g3~~TRINITY_DN7346_c0_g3_i1.p1  ORF type:complete len:593 (+),score=242.72 TRINITY_DN7346_c0_g3_i1:167-1780(+)